jgi:hypothetical protein
MGEEYGAFCRAGFLFQPLSGKLFFKGIAGFYPFLSINQRGLYPQ